MKTHASASLRWRSLPLASALPSLPSPARPSPLLRAARRTPRRREARDDSVETGLSTKSRNAACPPHPASASCGSSLSPSLGELPRGEASRSSLASADEEGAFSSLFFALDTPGEVLGSAQEAGVPSARDAGVSAAAVGEEEAEDAPPAPRAAFRPLEAREGVQSDAQEGGTPEASRESHAASRSAGDGQGELNARGGSEGLRETNERSARERERDRRKQAAEALASKATENARGSKKAGKKANAAPNSPALSASPAEEGGLEAQAQAQPREGETAPEASEAAEAGKKEKKAKKVKKEEKPRKTAKRRDVIFDPKEAWQAFLAAPENGISSLSAYEARAASDTSDDYHEARVVVGSAEELDRLLHAQFVLSAAFRASPHVTQTASLAPPAAPPFACSQFPAPAAPQPASLQSVTLQSSAPPQASPPRSRASSRALPPCAPPAGATAVGVAAGSPRFSSLASGGGASSARGGLGEAFPQASLGTLLCLFEDGTSTTRSSKRLAEARYLNRTYRSRFPEPVAFLLSLAAEQGPAPDAAEQPRGGGAASEQGVSGAQSLAAGAHEKAIRAKHFRWLHVLLPCNPRLFGGTLALGALANADGACASASAAFAPGGFASASPSLSPSPSSSFVPSAAAASSGAASSGAPPEAEGDFAQRVWSFLRLLAHVDGLMLRSGGPLFCFSAQDTLRPLLQRFPRDVLSFRALLDGSLVHWLLHPDAPVDSAKPGALEQCVAFNEAEARRLDPALALPVWPPLAPLATSPPPSLASSEADAADEEKKLQGVDAAGGEGGAKKKKARKPKAVRQRKAEELLELTEPSLVAFKVRRSVQRNGDGETASGVAFARERGRCGAGGGGGLGPRLGAGFSCLRVEAFLCSFAAFFGFLSQEELEATAADKGAAGVSSSASFHWHRVFRDAALLTRLSLAARHLLRENQLVRPLLTQEIPVAALLALLDVTGVAIQPQAYERLKSSLDAALVALEREVNRVAGTSSPVQVASPAQLSKLLFDDLALPLPGRAVAAVSGSRPRRAPAKNVSARSTAEEVLQEIADLHPVVPLIQSFRSLAKLRSTYVESTAALSLSSTCPLSAQEGAAFKVAFKIYDEIAPKRASCSGEPGASQGACAETAERGEGEDATDELCVFADAARDYPALYPTQHPRMFTRWNQTRTVTGRLSSSYPNLQNIPKVMELPSPSSLVSSLAAESASSPAAAHSAPSVFSHLPRNVNCRDAFRDDAQDGSSVLIAADYAQIEMRLLAHFCGAGPLQSLLLGRAVSGCGREADTNEPVDLYREMAALYADIPSNQVTKDLRDKVKVTCLALIYGSGTCTIARQMNISLAAASAFRSKFLFVFPDVSQFIRSIIAKGRDDGFVTTLTGRRRYIPEAKSNNSHVRALGERLSVNSCIQGSASDLMKIGMMRLQAELLAHPWDPACLPPRLLLSVHDELVLHCARIHLDPLAKMIKTCLTQDMPVDVPLDVSISAGPTWGALTKLAV
ncbi:DNA polymerase I domain-containing protein [Besnoitia besnoiti]|uniref:DNA-directed DNA polymerase n=1 Tax=Besnoitia besnoiti TaxID=94643 RepID=A0A2A9M9C5_BESBE|nr:DNA polymerase I domain-containing protein [Besnoitia besnoiti]PFH32283.1 DNA polymerase I domain-containing protein [Besnoitia besnoiti]